MTEHDWNMLLAGVVVGMLIASVLALLGVFG